MFAQGLASASWYSKNADFRKLVYAATLTGKDTMIAAEKAKLKALDGRRKREFRVVYAIFDDTANHKVARGATLTTKLFDGTLTPFAKVDLVDRVQSIRSMGYDDVVLTRILPP